jgi:ribosomal protein S18 acetylase RimI-like enzyme
MGFRFEQAQEEDWPRIIEWQAEIEWVELPPDRRHLVEREAICERVAERVRSLRADGGFPNEVLVAREADGSLAGYVWVARSHNDRTGRVEASLLGQFVSPEHRGQGLGGQLLELAEDWTRRQGLPCLSLFVSAKNTIAQRLYKSLGYEVESLRLAKQLDSGS